MCVRACGRVSVQVCVRSLDRRSRRGGKLNDDPREEARRARRRRRRRDFQTPLPLRMCVMAPPTSVSCPRRRLGRSQCSLAHSLAPFAASHNGLNKGGIVARRENPIRYRRRTLSKWKRRPRFRSRTPFLRCCGVNTPCQKRARRPAERNAARGAKHVGVPFLLQTAPFPPALERRARNWKEVCWPPYVYIEDSAGVTRERKSSAMGGRDINAIAKIDPPTSLHERCFLPMMAAASAAAPASASASASAYFDDRYGQRKLPSFPTPPRLA